MGGVYSQTFGDTTDYYESPPYSVVEEKDGYELRKYEASMWTSAKMDHRDDMTDEKMNSSMFWSLFNYISGKTNDEKQVNIARFIVYYEVPEFLQLTQFNNLSESFYDGACPCPK